MKTCPLIDNVCIYGDSSRSFVVALVCPDRLNLDRLASKLGKQDTDFTSLAADKVNHHSFTFAAYVLQGVVGAVLRELVQHGRNMKLEKFELPGAVSLVQVLRCSAPHCTALLQEVWTPDTELVTAAFKLKRKPLQLFYQKEINRMYGV